MTLEEFTNYIEANGESLEKINPGSTEKAIKEEEALEIIKKANATILGGDILINTADGLFYAYKIWGASYHYLNWYCEKKTNESEKDYQMRSVETAIESIEEANWISDEKGSSCYVVLVI